MELDRIDPRDHQGEVFEVRSQGSLYVIGCPTLYHRRTYAGRIIVVSDSLKLRLSGASNTRILSGCVECDNHHPRLIVLDEIMCLAQQGNAPDREPAHSGAVISIKRLAGASLVEVNHRGFLQLPQGHPLAPYLQHEQRLLRALQQTT